MEQKMNYRDEVRRRRQEREKARKKKMKVKIIAVLGVITILLISALTVICVNYYIPHDFEEHNVVKATPTSTEQIFAIEEPTKEPTEVSVVRRGTAEAIPEDICQTMRGYSMPANASISFDELSYLTIPHYDYNYNITEGHLVVNKALAEEVLDIFAELFDIKYPIERMELIDKYEADDYASIEYNNTSAFNYRESTDGSGSLSRHALGRAIDINPQINPYVNANGTGAHQNAREYWSRDISVWTSDIAKASYIGTDTEIYRIFVKKYGWEWGGSWSSYRDYQHFQKIN